MFLAVYKTTSAAANAMEILHGLNSKLFDCPRTLCQIRLFPIPGIWFPDTPSKFSSKSLINKEEGMKNIPSEAIFKFLYSFLLYPIEMLKKLHKDESLHFRK